MSKKIKLADVPIGKSIGAFGKKFTVLDHIGEGVLVLSENIEIEMPFRDECKARVAPNDFRDSDICRYLNGEYLDKLISSAKDTDAIIDMEIDLKCTLGQLEYGTWKAKVGLLTLEQYGKYYHIIPKVDGYWWLATPYATPLRSPYSYYTNYVWKVRSDGLHYLHHSYDSYVSARPALVLNPLLLVSCDDISGDDTSNNKTTRLSDFSDEELLEEIRRRFKMTGLISSKNKVEDDCNG